MKTEDLVGLLASGAGAAPRAAVARRVAPALAAAFLASVALSLAALGPVPSAMWSGAALWTKLGYAASLALGCAWLTARLARPAAPILAASSGVVAVIAAMALIGVIALAGMPEVERPAYLLGRTAARCPWIILALSLPALIAMIWALRGLAPTRLHLTGLAAGLLAGAVGAAAYALSCDELSIAFIAVWYSLGIALSGALGSALGGRLLRW